MPLLKELKVNQCSGAINIPRLTALRKINLFALRAHCGRGVCAPGF